MKDVECPYCGSDQDIEDNGQDWRERKFYEQECNHCHKMFMYEVFIQYSFEAYKEEDIDKVTGHKIIQERKSFFRLD